MSAEFNVLKKILNSHNIKWFTSTVDDYHFHVHCTIPLQFEKKPANPPEWYVHLMHHLSKIEGNSLADLIRGNVSVHNMREKISIPPQIVQVQTNGDFRARLARFSIEFLANEFIFRVDDTTFWIDNFTPRTPPPTSDLPLSNPAAVEALLKTWTPPLPDTAPFVEPFCAFMQQAVIAHLKNPRPKQYELRFTHGMAWWTHVLQKIDVPEHARTNKKWVFRLLTAAVKINFRIAHCETAIGNPSDSEIELIFEFTH